MKRLISVFSLGVLLGTHGAIAQSQINDQLHPPVPVTVMGRPLDVQRVGHAAPFFDDIDDDGLPDLLVGQYHEGKVRLYTNRGDRSNPRFSDYQYVKAGDGDAKVPSG